MIRKWFNQVRYGKIEKSDSPEDICVICYENWTNAGPHGLASLPCGHLFGHSCITQWLRNGQTCPVCNHSTTAADIRLIRARNLTAIDNSNEVILRREVDELKVKNRALQTHCDRLTKINNFLYLTTTCACIVATYGLVSSILVSFGSRSDTSNPVIGDVVINISSYILFMFKQPFVFLWHLTDFFFTIIFAMTMCTVVLWAIFSILHGSDTGNAVIISVMNTIIRFLENTFPN